MGMAEDAEYLRQSRMAAESSRANSQALRQQRDWVTIDQAVREFVPIALQRGLATNGTFRRYWRIVIAGGHGALDSSTYLIINTSGHWSLSYYDPDANVSNNKPREMASSDTPGVCTDGGNLAAQVRPKLIEKLSSR